MKSILIAAATVIVLSAIQPLKAQQTPNTDRVRRAVDDLFARQDKNGDGKLTREEFPQKAIGLFDRIDADKNGEVTKGEDSKFRTSRGQGRPQPDNRRRQPPPEPDYPNVSYGPHERNIFDLWLAKSEKPTPLVIFYHGGGFRGGDKRTINLELLKRLRESGVSVAAVNYRLTNVAPFPAQMHDCARALQFIRSRAKDYNIAPTRVGATGGSAGAGISQWLAFHEDLAAPKAEDPVLRQSTRISCAVVYAAQTSYDPRFIQKLFDTDQVDGALLPFFGMKSAEDVSEPKFHPLFKEASMIDHATEDDPPVMLYYPQPNKPLPPNSSGREHIHHPKFGEVLKKKLDELGVECIVKFREDCPNGAPVEDYVAFFLRHLGEK